MGRLRHWWLPLAVLWLAGAALIAACDEADRTPEMRPVVTVPPHAPIKIGISAPFETEHGERSERIAQAAALAALEVTVGGHAFEFVHRDDGCNAEGGEAAARALIEQDVVAVVGPICVSAAIAAQPIFEEAGVPVVSPSVSAIAATSADGRPPYRTFFRVTYNDAIQGSALARFAGEELEARSAYIVFYEEVYGRALREGFEEAFGGRVVGAESFESGETDFSAAVERIRGLQPDLVFFAGFFPEAAPFVRQLRELGLETRVISPDGVRDDRFLEEAGDAAEGVYVSVPSPVLGNDVYQQFRAEFQSVYGEPPDTFPFAAEAYDAATVIIEALRLAGVEDGDALVVDLRRLREAIAETNLVGTMGRIRFDARGDNVGEETPVALFQVEGGRFRQVGGVRS